MHNKLPIGGEGQAQLKMPFTFNSFYAAHFLHILAVE